MGPESLEEILTAVMTRMLPKVTMRQIRPRGTSEPTTYNDNIIRLEPELKWGWAMNEVEFA